MNFWLRKPRIQLQYRSQNEVDPQVALMLRPFHDVPTYANSKNEEEKYLSLFARNNPNRMCRSRDRMGFAIDSLAEWPILLNSSYYILISDMTGRKQMAMRNERYRYSDVGIPIEMQPILIETLPIKNTTKVGLFSSSSRPCGCVNFQFRVLAAQ
jgi:hypothetical protein